MLFDIGRLYLAKFEALTGLETLCWYGLDHKRDNAAAGTDLLRFVPTNITSTTSSTVRWERSWGSWGYFPEPPAPTRHPLALLCHCRNSFSGLGASEPEWPDHTERMVIECVLRTTVHAQNLRPNHHSRRFSISRASLCFSLFFSLSWEHRVPRSASMIAFYSHFLHVMKLHLRYDPLSQQPDNV